MTITNLDILTLKRAAEIAGGEEALALRLQVSPSRVSSWLAAKAPVPQAIFLRAVDIVLEYEHAQFLGAATPGSEDAKDRRG